MDSSDDETGNSCVFRKFRAYEYTGVSAELSSIADMPFCVSLRRLLRFRI